MGHLGNIFAYYIWCGTVSLRALWRLVWSWKSEWCASNKQQIDRFQRCIKTHKAAHFDTGRDTHWRIGNCGVDCSWSTFRLWLQSIFDWSQYLIAINIWLQSIFDCNQYLIAINVWLQSIRIKYVAPAVLPWWEMWLYYEKDFYTMFSSTSQIQTQWLPVLRTGILCNLSC